MLTKKTRAGGHMPPSGLTKGEKGTSRPKAQKTMVRWTDTAKKLGDVTTRPKPKHPK